MLTQKQKDISNLLDVRSLILTSDFDDPDKCLIALAQIGQALHSISWKEDEKTCIRNKHGLRNRCQTEGNKRNPEGAKLDFETLSHIQKLVEDNQSRSILINNSVAIKESLKNLKAKIDYIITAEYTELNAEQRAEVPLLKNRLSASEESDLGFLWRAAAYYHDQQCLKRLIKLLEEFNSIANEDLNQPVNCHRLGYILCQLGENAKELSDFVKPEQHKQAEDNLTRFMFGKLGHYRQKIKQHPFIVKKNNTQELRQMRFLINEVSPLLESLLRELQERLNTFEVQQRVTNYHECNLPDKKGKSLFEKDNLVVLKVVTHYLGLGITSLDDLIKRQKHINQETIGFSEKKVSLEQEQENPIIKPVVTPQAVLNKEVEQIRGILAKPELSSYLHTTIAGIQQLIQGLSPTSDKKLLGLIKTFATKISSKNNINNIALCCNCDSAAVSAMTLAQLKDKLQTVAVKEKTEPNSSTSGNKQKIHTLTKRITQNQLHLQQIREDIEFLAEKPELQVQHRPKAPSLSQPTHQNSSSRYFSYIFEQIELTEDFYELGESASSNSVKMSLGLIGHYAKEIRKNSATDVKLKQYTHILVESCFKNAEYLRSKVIMHDMANANHATIEKTWNESILPTKDDIRALSIVFQENTQPQGLLARAFMRLGDDKNALTVLAEYLEELELGKSPVESHWNQSITHNHEVAPLISIFQTMRQVGIERFGEAFVNYAEQFACHYDEKTRVLILMAKCYQNRQSMDDLQKGLALIEKAIKKIKFSLQVLKQQTPVSGHNNVKESLNLEVDKWLFCHSVKAFFLIKIGEIEQARFIMTQLEAEFNREVYAKEKFAVRIIHLFTDLASITNDRTLQREYLSKAEKWLPYSERKVFSQYLVQLRLYEYAYTGFLAEPNPENFDDFRREVEKLINFFASNRTTLQQETAMKIFEFEMTVLLADLKLKLTNTELYASEIEELFRKLDDIERHIVHNALKKDYFSLKTIYLAKLNKLDLFKECLQEFVKFGQENAPMNFREELLTTLNTLLPLNLAEFTLIGLDFIEQIFATLTEEESQTKMIATLSLQSSKKPASAPKLNTRLLPNPNSAPTNFITNAGLDTAAAQLNRITASICTESWKKSNNNSAITLTSTESLAQIKKYLEKLDIGDIEVNDQGQNQRITIGNLKGRNLSDIPSMPSVGKMASAVSFKSQ